MKNTVTFNGVNLAPSKVVCVGRNYVEHIKELDNAIPIEPVIFVKPNSAISSELVLAGNDEIHYEAELAFLIEAGQLKAVGLGLDLTKRQIQHELKEKGLPWERAKAFDQSAVLSEFVAIVGDETELRLELFINGDLKQQGGCSMMLYSPSDLVKEVNSFMTLVDGDVLLTGTPAGVGRVHLGDEFMGKVYAGDQLLVEACWSANN